MIRDVGSLANTEFDLVVIGGGIFGAWAALDAALRGLRVALVELQDFGSGTSANPYKIAHGGIRYIQHLDLVRVRQSCAERSALLRTAPHLVKPLPIVIPTYGHGKKGRWFLRTGTRLYDAVTSDRNVGVHDASRRIPNCSSVGLDEVERSFPGVARRGMTGGVRFHDAQIHSPPRLVWSVVRSAIEAGAIALNYVAAIGFTCDGNRVTGVTVRDELTGDEMPVRCRSVLSTAGAWAERLIAESLGLELEPASVFSRDLCFALNRPWPVDDALALSGQTFDPSAVISRGARHLFLVPWRGLTLAGVWHSIRTDRPEDVEAEWSEIEEYLRELNAGYLGQNYSTDEVSFVNFGLVLFGKNREGAQNLRYGTRSRIVDHAETHGISGLHTLIGVRFTTGRADAAAALRTISAYLGSNSESPATDHLPVWGGDATDLGAVVEGIRSKAEFDLAPGVLQSVAQHHGSRYRELLEVARSVPNGLHPLGESHVLRGQVVMAARCEGAVHLDDALFRRTELASACDPGQEAIDEAARLMAHECGWSEARTLEESERVDRLLRRHLARP